MVSSLPLLGICKEVAPTKQCATDEELGVGEFQSKYFSPGKLYLDEDKVFYEAMGNRKINLLSMLNGMINPLPKYRSQLAEYKARLESKEVEGNMMGDGLVQGGVLVVGPGKLEYVYLEDTGQEIPSDEIEAAIRAVAAVPAMQV